MKSDSHDFEPDHERSAQMRAELESLAEHADEAVRAARAAASPADRALVRRALDSATLEVPAAAAAPRRPPRAWLAWAAAAALLLGLFAVWRSSQPNEARRWLSGPAWVQLVDGDAPALRFERELPSSARYAVTVWAGDPREQVCSETTRGPLWQLPPAALQALESQGRLELLVELLDDSGTSPSAPARLELRSR